MAKKPNYYTLALVILAAGISVLFTKNIFIIAPIVIVAGFIGEFWFRSVNKQ